MKKIFIFLMMLLLPFTTIFTNEYSSCDNNISRRLINKRYQVPSSTENNTFFIGSATAPFEFVGEDTTSGSAYRTTFRNVLTTFNHYYLNSLGSFTNEYSSYEFLDYNYIDVAIQLPYMDTGSINPLANRKIISNDDSGIGIGFYSPNDETIGGYAYYNYNSIEHIFNTGFLSTSSWTSIYRLRLDVFSNKLQIPLNIPLYFTFELINVEPLFSNNSTGYNVISVSSNVNYTSLDAVDINSYIENVINSDFNSQASYEQGFVTGRTEGYQEGLKQGSLNCQGSTAPLANVFGIFESAATSLIGIFSIPIMPGITLGTLIGVFVGIPLLLLLLKHLGK